MKKLTCFNCGEPLDLSNSYCPSCQFFTYYKYFEENSWENWVKIYQVIQTHGPFGMRSLTRYLRDHPLPEPTFYPGDMLLTLYEIGWLKKEVSTDSDELLPGQTFTHSYSAVKRVTFKRDRQIWDYLRSLHRQRKLREEKLDAKDRRERKRIENRIKKAS